MPERNGAEGAGGVGAWSQRTAGQHAPMLVRWPGASTSAPKEVFSLPTYVVEVLKRSEARDSGGLGKKGKKQTNKQAGTLVAVRAWYCTGAESEDRWMRWGEKAERKMENGNRPAPWESGLANLPQPLPLRHSSTTAVPAVVLARAHTSPQSRWNTEEQISPTFVTCIFQSDFVQKWKQGTANSLPWVFFFSFLIKRLALTSKIFSFTWFFFIFYPPPTLRVGGEISNQISAKQGAGAAEKRHSLKIWYRVFWKWLWEKKKREKKIFLLFRPLLSLPPQPPLSNLHFLISAIKRFASKHFHLSPRWGLNRIP